MPIIESLLDQDTYKLCMGQAVFNQYPNVHVTYRFINRGGTKFTTRFVSLLREQIDSFSNLSLQDDEYYFLRDKCYYLKPTYLDFLRGYRFDPSEVTIRCNKDGVMDLRIAGPWFRVIFWEVPLLALISELHFAGHNVSRGPKWIEPSADAFQLMKQKATKIKFHKIKVADFGSRRRFSHHIQDKLTETMKLHAGEHFVGTSNLFFAKKYGVTPIGTQAHEFIMAHAVMFGFKMAHKMSFESWVNEYQGNLGIALADTFTHDVFFKDFTTKYAKLFDGIRCDSGKEVNVAHRLIEHYKSKHIDPTTKTVVFSNGLTTDRAIEINDSLGQDIKCSFGIGTHFTNDVGCIPLNMVIKMDSCNGIPTIKLSDEEGKETGNAKMIEYCKYILGISNP
jgi:nicotinate phosphoribosyltransferase